MRLPAPLPDFSDTVPTLDELTERKRVADRSSLLDHVDHLVRPPGWVYREIEEAIEHAIAGRFEAKIQSRDGCDYSVAELVERWELDEELLDLYRRPADDPSYEDRW